MHGMLAMAVMVSMMVTAVDIMDLVSFRHIIGMQHRGLYHFFNFHWLSSFGRFTIWSGQAWEMALKVKQFFSRRYERFF